MHDKFGPGARELFADLGQPSEVGGAAGVTRYLHDLYRRRPDLRAGYPHLEGEGARGLVGWAREHGAAGVDQPPIPPVLLGATGLPEPEPWSVRARRARHTGGAPGVNLIGYLHGELGLGEAARLAGAALRAAGVPVAAVGRPVPWTREGHDYPTVALEDASFDVNLVCLNPAQHWQLVREAGPAYVAERPAIGFWWWEIADVAPIEWRFGFPLLDELWVGSEHTASAFRPVSPVPVAKVRLPVVPNPATGRTRAELGLPGGFLFLMSFDYNSTLARKNPGAVIEAFGSAFAPGSGASLVVKSTNGERHPEDHEAVREAAAGHPDVHLLDRYVSAADKDALLAACDCYVALHRAEGFGLPLAEAMYLGRPAIATRYSGNLEFMTDENSWLVEHGMTSVGPALEPHYPAEAGWADPDVEHAARLMREVFDDPERAGRRARRGAQDIRRHHSPAAAASSMAARLERYAISSSSIR